MRFLRAFAVASAALVTGVPVCRGDIVITDTTFTNANWSETTSGSGSAASLQDSGFGNTAPSRRTSISNVGDGQTGTATSLYAATTYNPSTQGAILSWTWTLDYRNQTDAAVSVLGSFALSQNSFIYVANSSFAPVTAAWNTATAPQPVASNWIRLSGAGPANPDFTTGSTISFGYSWSFTGGASPAEELDNVDNFSLSGTTQSVPEPSALVLTGIVAVAAGAFTLRQRHRRLPAN